MGGTFLLVVWIALVESLAVAASLFALSSAAARWLKLEPWRALFAGLAALGLAGFVQFWATFFSIGLAPIVQAAFGFGVAALLVLAFLRRRQDDGELIAPCILVFTASVILIVWSYAGASAEELANPLRYMTTRWTTQLSTDNEIPWTFAEQLRQAQVFTPFYGNWLSSDRPPLQTGLYLLLDFGGGGRLWYQACATALQLTVLAAAWALARALGMDRRWAMLTAIAVLLTPLVVNNATYVWPKLLAAAYVCGVFALHFFRDRERPLFTGTLAGLSAALAMLAHGSSAFALLGIAVAALAVLSIGSWRYVAAGCAFALVLQAPWSAYQRFYDPPGDRLLKWHLAGVVEPNAKPFLEQLPASYATLTWGTWSRARLANLAGIAGVPSPNDMPPPATGALAKARNYAFGLVAAGMGLFGLALYASPALLAPKRTRMLAGAAIATLLAWALLIFLPGQTMAKNGSYFPQLALVIAVMLLLASTPKRRTAGLILIAAQALLVGVLYGAA